MHGKGQYIILSCKSDRISNPDHDRNFSSNLFFQLFFDFTEISLIKILLTLDFYLFNLYFIKIKELTQRYKRFEYSLLSYFIRKQVNQMKQRLNEPTINKIQILQWINSTLNCNQSKIQSLGNGIIYCMLMNHYYPNSVPKNKIIMLPRNNMDNKGNLKKVQQALLHQNIRSITFDIFRVSEMSYLDNWQLVCKLYRHFNELTKNSQKQPEISNMISQNQQLMNQTLQQVNPQPQNPYILPKQVSKTPDFGAGLLTPMKGLKFFEQNTKMRYQALRLMQEIKAIVKSETETDKIKVKNLKKMLGLIEQEREEEELEMKELFSDCTRKQEVITID